jgi:hypothetical protein
VYILYRRRVWRTSAPAVSICRDGEISFNKALTQLFLRNGYECALFLFDPEEKKIAVRLLKNADIRAYRIVYHRNACQSWVCAKSFLKTLGWQGGRHQLKASWDPRQLQVEIAIPDLEKRAKARVVVMQARCRLNQKWG